MLNQAFSGLLTVIQVAYLVFRSFTTSEYFLPGQVLNVLCTVLVVVLVVVENRRTIRPSSVLILYLLSTLIVDAILLRTLLLQGHELLTVSLLPASIACKAILLFLEHLPRTFPEKTKHEYSPEELSGILGRVVFWYMNPLLRLGNKKILALDDLYPLNHEFRSESLELSIEAIWKGCKSPLLCPKGLTDAHRQATHHLQTHIHNPLVHENKVPINRFAYFGRICFQVLSTFSH